MQYCFAHAHKKSFLTICNDVFLNENPFLFRGGCSSFLGNLSLIRYFYPLLYPPSFSLPFFFPPKVIFFPPPIPLCFPLLRKLQVVHEVPPPPPLALSSPNPSMHNMLFLIHFMYGIGWEAGEKERGPEGVISQNEYARAI